MNLNVQLPKNLTSDAVNFSEVKKNDYGGKSVYVTYEGSPLIVQTPFMPMPFGLSAFEDKDRDFTKYSVDFSFRNMDDNKAVENFYKFLETMDHKLINAGVKNSLKWFGKNYKSEDIVEALYSNQIRHSIDKETGEVNHKYAPTFKLRVPHRDGRFNVEVYDMDKTRTYDDVRSLVTKGGTARAIMSCSGVWFAGGKFGVSWRLLHLQVQPSNTIKNYSFLEDSDNEDNEDNTSEFYGKA